MKEYNRLKDCGLCDIAKGSETYRTTFENDYAISVIITNPFNATHQMILPKRHISTLDELTANESLSLHLIQNSIINRLMDLFPSEESEKYSPTISMNTGMAQTQLHLHMQAYLQASHTRHSFSYSHEKNDEIGFRRKGQWKITEGEDIHTHPKVPTEALEEIAKHIKGTNNLKKDRDALIEINKQILFPK